MEDEDSQLSLLERVSPRPHTKKLFNNESMTTGPLNIQNDVIDDFVRGQEIFEESQRRDARAASRSGIFKYLNVGIMAFLLAAIVAAIGFGLRYGNYRTGANRYLIACGLYGMVTSIANYLAIHVLLKTMFLARNERLLQTSVREIVMNLVFSRDVVDMELVTEVRKSITTPSVHRTVRNCLGRPAAQQLIDKKVGQIFRSPEGMILSMLGISEEQLRAMIGPAVIKIVADVAPLLEQELTIDQFVSSEHIYEMLSRVVAVRVEALSVADLQSIVSGVLLPQLSFIVLWGCIVGMILGAVSEAIKLSEFITNSGG